MVVGDKKWTENNNSQDLGRKGEESGMTPGFGFRQQQKGGHFQRYSGVPLPKSIHTESQ